MYRGGSRYGTDAGMALMHHSPRRLWRSCIMAPPSSRWVITIIIIIPTGHSERWCHQSIVAVVVCSSLLPL